MDLHSRLRYFDIGNNSFVGARHASKQMHRSLMPPMHAHRTVAIRTVISASDGLLHTTRQFAFNKNEGARP